MTRARVLGGTAALLLPLVSVALRPVTTLAQTAPDAAEAGLSSPADANLLEAVERRLAILHRRLAITPDQEPLWERFAAVVRRNSLQRQANQAGRARRIEPSTAVEELRYYAGVAQDHAGELQQLIPVFEALYANMTPEQKASADRTMQQFLAQAERRRGRD